MKKEPNSKAHILNTNESMKITEPVDKDIKFHDASQYTISKELKKPILKSLISYC